jgi:HD-GYP domain-containing protein (c-di-GMP phosphodiesterase class II)
MRILPTACLKPGMILERNIIDNNHQLLLSKGQILTENSIQRIKMKENEILHVCIADDLIEDRKQEECISFDIRLSAVQVLRGIFIDLDRHKMINENSITKAKNIVDDMIGEILSTKSATVSMNDLKMFDDYTYHHSVNVTVLSLVLGTVMGLNRDNLRKLGLGAILHDIGKLFIPKEILNKDSSLTKEEFEQVKLHSRKGYEYLRDIRNISAGALMPVLMHHERYNGTGYPEGLEGKNIHMSGRIVAVADVFDALTSNRPYRNALPPSEAMEYILGNCGSHFDPEVVEMLFGKLSLYPIGTQVILSNGMEGVVVENRPRSGLRPKVRIISDEVEPIYYDLGTDMNLLNVTITGIKNKDEDEKRLLFIEKMKP